MLRRQWPAEALAMCEKASGAGHSLMQAYEAPWHRLKGPPLRGRCPPPQRLAQGACIIVAIRSMSPAVQKRLALAAFILMVLTLLVTLVRPRIPGSTMSRAELIGLGIQIVIA